MPTRRWRARGASARSWWNASSRRGFSPNGRPRKRCANGQTMRGWIDVLIETAEGWVIIDHKSSPRPKSEWRAEALEHSGQLASYRSMIGHGRASGGLHVDSLPGERRYRARRLGWRAMSETLNHTTPHCPNCGAPRTENFCSACGQNSRSYLRATRDIVGDVLSETLDLDSRLGRTLRFLLLRPGHLSREFASERRASYVSPGRLYIVVSLVFFGVLSLVTRFEPEVQPRLPQEAQHDIAADPDMTQMYQAAERGAARAAERDSREAGRVYRGRPAAARRTRRRDSNARRRRRCRHSKAPCPTGVLDLAENPRGAYETVISDLPAAMFLHAAALCGVAEADVPAALLFRAPGVRAAPARIPVLHRHVHPDAAGRASASSSAVECAPRRRCVRE